MSNQYPGGFITKNPPTPSGPYADSTAQGLWNLSQQAAYKQQGLWPTQGNVNPDLFIENLFSTYLYTGTGASQTITNNIDLSTKGGLVWLKGRNFASFNGLIDTVRGSSSCLVSSSTAAANGVAATGISAFNSTGFTLNTNSDFNGSTNTQVSWTFREQAKFFDIVTYTGNGTAGRTVAHNLGAVPGVIIVKRTDGGTNWRFYHRSLGATQYLDLDETNAANTATTIWNDTAPTSAVFSVGTNSGVNASGGTYVAYLFAHDAGGFGLTGTDNVISCGSFTVSGGNASVTLGYEPQWVLVKNITDAGSWLLFDIMRGMPVGGGDAYLQPNTTNAESSGTDFINPTATGFNITNLGGSQTFIYIAIRRGPMAVPTTGTSVYENTAYTGNGASNRLIGSSVLTDLLLLSNTNATSDAWASYAQFFFDRLRGQNVTLATSRTDAETSGWISYFNLDMNTGWDTGSTTDQVYLNKTSSTYVSNIFRRAPSFMDVVCYTGTGANQNITHNLTVAPELIIVKSRSSNPGANWVVWVTGLNTSTGYLYLNGDLAGSNFAGVWNGAPTSSYFTLGTNYQNNGSGVTFVSYLFATCAGVSKVGSYTGTGTTQTINCGFTAGSRFVLIKRTDSTGDWYVWNSASGIVAGNDPYILLNSAAAQVTGTDYIDTASSGFEISSTAPAAINANGGTFIFLAIA